MELRLNLRGSNSYMLKCFSNTQGEVSLKAWEVTIKTEKDLAGKEPKEIINKKTEIGTKQAHI